MVQADLPDQLSTRIQHEFKVKPGSPLGLNSVRLQDN